METYSCIYRFKEVLHFKTLSSQQNIQFTAWPTAANIHFILISSHNVSFVIDDIHFKPFRNIYASIRDKRIVI